MAIYKKYKIEIETNRKNMILISDVLARFKFHTSEDWRCSIDGIKGTEED